jgi:hypothetical protein
MLTAGVKDSAPVEMELLENVIIGQTSSSNQRHFTESGG